MKDIVIIGASGFGREVKDIIDRINDREETYRVIGFIDDDESLHGEVLNDVPVLGGSDWIVKNGEKEKLHAVIAVANAPVKKKLDALLSPYVTWETIIDPSASLSRYMEIGEGTVIQAGGFIGANVTIGRHCVINTKSGIGHDAVLEDYAAIMSFCDVTGHCHLEEGAYFGSSVCVIPSTRIGRYATAGAGAVIIRDVPAGATVVGSPARVIRQE